MAFFDNLSSFKKREILTSAQYSLSVELTNLLLRNNIDPSTFDEKSFDLINFPEIEVDGIRIGKLCESLCLIETRLDELV